MSNSRNEHEQQILGRVRHDDFVGRSAELEQLVSHAVGRSQAANENDLHGLLLLAAPFAGGSELLRQTFDSLFRLNQEVVPIYFELPRTETTVVSAAIEFLNTFLRQYLAFRRREPNLCEAALTLHDIRALATSADKDWIDSLVEAYDELRFGEDDRELVRFCLNSPNRVPKDVRSFVMFDTRGLAAYETTEVSLGRELFNSLNSAKRPFVIAGLRRELLDFARRRSFANYAQLRLEPLTVADSLALISSIARRYQLSIRDDTRELLVQQLESRPYFITAFLQAARDKRLMLDSYFACERLYVDELMGGTLNRQFAAILEDLAPEPATRAGLVRLLCEALPRGKRSVTFESWRRSLKLDSAAAEKLFGKLHSEELINWSNETISLEDGSEVWKDYFRGRFRLDALQEPRALVVADLMAGALKRAPETIARFYGRADSLSLLDLLNRFDTQLVPRKLFEYSEFAPLYKGATDEEVALGLVGETDLMRLPQVFHAASGISFSASLRSFGEENVAVAHAFSGANYTDPDEVVWLVAKIESKLEANLDLVEKWLSLLEGIARQCGFIKTQFWLIANEGFTEDASRLMRERRTFGSSRQQFQLLSRRLGADRESPQQALDEDEFTFVFPMGGDNELLAAITAEQIARRIDFTPEAINQIKTAVVEACINASEHSLSPDRKIYQRLRVENDRLVVTISSRGVLPRTLEEGVRDDAVEEAQADLTSDRRGWGLKLIRTLMDEVEFEKVDEGTRLRMVKYLRRTPAVEPSERS